LPRPGEPDLRPEERAADPTLRRQRRVHLQMIGCDVTKGWAQPMANEMHSTGKNDSMSRNPKRSAALLAMAAIIAVASGCANADRTATGALPDDYRTRHPIVVGEQERTIDIPVATGATQLTRGQSDVIAGFASR